MAKSKAKSKKQASKAAPDPDRSAESSNDEDVVLEGTLICALTGEHKKATDAENLTQSLIEQLHREYGVDFNDMARGVRVKCVTFDEAKGKETTKNRTVTLVVYENGADKTLENIVRVAVVAAPGTKATKKSIGVLQDILANLSDEREQVFGLWTNGGDLKFQMRTFHKRTGQAEFTDLADFPAPDETLEELEDAERRPLRVAGGDSLLRTFKRCHDYLYGNQSMRGDRAFWQLLYLIFAKILDEQESRRLFFVGATEANTEKGQKAIAKRIKKLFEEVKSDVYADVFDGSERIELNDRALAYIAGELSRYSLLSTDTDAKGMAYEAITSTTLKRERGQFFTPRNVIRMMVEMCDPQSNHKIFDPACGSGGFLVVALAHVRRQLLEQTGCPYPAQPLPLELRKIDKKTRSYAKKNLYGVDVDPELRKAARMNMVMNNDGHGNICHFNSLEYGISSRRTPEMKEFEQRGGGHGKFDFVFTNPPFGAKIPIDDPEVLQTFDLGHSWNKVGSTWQRGAVLKKVPPEILFIESCMKFLKPGSGTMAIVLPNGILGNPGDQMEAVRWWMLHHMELLASIDLPGETFLPQVSVQASCVFLRRRDAAELRMATPAGPKQRPVFMAIADVCGHGRRGEPTYIRTPDGREALQVAELVERWERHGKVVETLRKKQVKTLADDLPWIANQYQRHVAGLPLETD